MKLALLTDTGMALLESDKESPSKQLADLALQMDEKILFDQLPVKLVCLLVNTPIINYDSIFAKQLHHNGVYYISDDYADSFYCKPHVFSVLGSLYKVNFTRLNFKEVANDTQLLLAEKIIFLINRLGYEFYVSED